MSVAIVKGNTVNITVVLMATAATPALLGDLTPTFEFVVMSTKVGESTKPECLLEAFMYYICRSLMLCGQMSWSQIVRRISEPPKS